MQIPTSKQNVSTIDKANVSIVDKALGITLAAFSMFVVGYTATRVYLGQSQNPNVTPDNNAEFVIPHQATLWSVLGE